MSNFYKARDTISNAETKSLEIIRKASMNIWPSIKSPSTNDEYIESFHMSWMYLGGGGGGSNVSSSSSSSLAALSPPSPPPKIRIWLFGMKSISLRKLTDHWQDVWPLLYEWCIFIGEPNSLYPSCLQLDLKPIRDPTMFVSKNHHHQQDDYDMMMMMGTVNKKRQQQQQQRNRGKKETERDLHVVETWQYKSLEDLKQVLDLKMPFCKKDQYHDLHLLDTVVLVDLVTLLSNLQGDEDTPSQLSFNSLATEYDSTTHYPIFLSIICIGMIRLQAHHLFQPITLHPAHVRDVWINCDSRTLCIDWQTSCAAIDGLWRPILPQRHHNSTFHSTPNYYLNHMRDWTNDAIKAWPTMLQQKQQQQNSSSSSSKKREHSNSMIIPTSKKFKNG